MTANSERLAVRSQRTGEQRMINNVFVFICSLLTVFLLTVSLAQAQQPGRIPRIGLLFAAPPSANSARIEALRQGLRELGYVEGKNIVIEWRYAEGKPHRLSPLVAELVRLKVDVIVSASSVGTRSFKEATNTIPIVMTSDTDPVGNGFVASLARPGGNITGLSTLGPEIIGKRLQLLKEVVPHLAQLAVLDKAPTPGNAQGLQATELAARAPRVQPHNLDVRRPDEVAAR